MSDSNASTLKRELTAAQDDSKRLDWLFAHDHFRIEDRKLGKILYTREEIDAAMREGEL